MKIRWYRWVIYKLWRRTWTPILIKNKWCRAAFTDSFLEYEMENSSFATVNDLLINVAPKFYVDYIQSGKIK